MRHELRNWETDLNNINEGVVNQVGLYLKKRSQLITQKVRRSAGRQTSAQPQHLIEPRRIANLAADSAQFDCYVSTRVPNADDNDTFAIIAARVVEVVSVNSGSLEVLFTVKVSHIFLGMMTGADHGSVKNLGSLFASFFYYVLVLPIDQSCRSLQWVSNEQPAIDILYMFFCSIIRAARYASCWNGH